MNGLLQARDAFADFADVESRLLWERSHPHQTPAVTIAIPTFNRIDTLVEAVGSALTQETETPFDIIIVDNGNVSDELPSILNALAKGRTCSVRYYRNNSNIGMFGNWNRCIELASSQWLTILNDDDLLRPTFLQQCFKVLESDSSIDGLVCKKDINDRRPATRVSRSRRLVVPVVGLVQSWTREMTYANNIRKVTPRDFFFGNSIGNGAGFLMKREVALKLGGYDPLKAPSADFFFYLLMALTYNLYHFNKVLADVGIGDNESMSKEVLLAFVKQLQEAREALAGDAVPRSWLKMSPLIVANQLAGIHNFWHEQLSLRQVEEMLGFEVPPPSFRKEAVLRMWNGIL